VCQEIGDAPKAAHASAQSACIIAAASDFPSCLALLPKTVSDTALPQTSLLSATALALARQVIQIESEAVAALADRIDASSPWPSRPPHVAGVWS
jgi:hypothetical protein